MTASSSNETLVANNNIMLGGSGSERTVTVTPSADQSGTATITLTVSDGASSATTSFALTVNPVNDAPTVSAIADRTVALNTSTGPISFTVGDVDNTAASLGVSGSSSNPALVPNQNIAFGGSDAQRTLTITPAPNQSGTTTITVTVSDGSLNASTAFTLTVLPGTEPPVITAQPQSQTVTVGADVTFRVSATGSPTLSYQWRFNGTAIPGAAAESYIVSSAELSDAGDYSVVVTNQAGSVISQSATLTVNMDAVFSGRATTLALNVLGVAEAWSDTGELPESGGAREASLWSLAQPDLLTANIGHAFTIGQADRTRSEASVGKFTFNVDGVTIGADFVMARATAAYAADGTSLNGGSEIAGLVIDGQPIAVTNEPNQTVSLPTGRIVINEQSHTAGSIVVTGLHIVVPNEADIVLGFARAGFASLAQPPITGSDYVSGGGWIAGTPDGAKGKFGLSVGMRDSVLSGHVDYQDDGAGIKMRSKALGGYQLGATPNARRIEGTAEIDGVDGFTFVVEVTDNGEPGRNDIFSITVSNGYHASGTLGGGNLQLHEPGR